MFSVVFSSANQRLVIFNHTGIAVIFQQVIEGLHGSVVVYDMGGVSAARRGWEGREIPCPRGESWALSPDPQPPSLASTRWADPAVVLPFQQPVLQHCWPEWWTFFTQALLPPVRWIPAFLLPHHSHKALMTLQVTWHSQRFSNPHAWLQKDTSPSKGQSRQ